MSFQDFKDNTTRAVVSRTIDGVLNYINKDADKQDQSLLKLVDISEKLMSDKFGTKVFSNARKLICTPDSKWMNFTYKLLDEMILMLPKCTY